MNKKGFTLVELIVTIALIGLVGVVLSINMINVINNQKADDEAQAKKLLEEAACTYYSLSTNDCGAVQCTVKGALLVKEGLIDEEINGININNYWVYVITRDGERTCKVRD